MSDPQNTESKKRRYRRAISSRLRFLGACALAVIVIETVLAFLIKNKMDDYATADDLIRDVPLWVIFFCGIGVGATVILYFVSRQTARWLEIGLVKGEGIESALYKRAARLRKNSMIALFSIFLLVIGATIVFFKAASFAGEDLQSLKKAAVAVIDMQKITPAASPDAMPDGEALKELIKRGVDAWNPKDTAVWAPIVLLLVLRLGDIAVASFLTLMLVRIYRYNIRLAAFYDSRADAITLCMDTRVDQISRDTLPILMDSNFDLVDDRASLVRAFAELLKPIGSGFRKSGSEGKKVE